jgi:hypothetical protein
LAVPVFLLAKVAVPPVRLTASPETAPLSDRPVMIAAVVPSYSLLAAVKLPVTVAVVMSAVAVQLVLTV